MMLSYWKLHKIPILLVLGSVLFYLVFAYDLRREDFIKLLSLFAALFFLFIKLIQFEKWNFKFLLVAGIAFRLVFIAATPNLSQDFYRFLWDGELIKLGVNPYLYTPDEIIANSLIQFKSMNTLYEGMGALSARHFSNYPPINQLLFYLSSWLGMGSIASSIVCMRLFIIGADVGVLLIGRKLLQHAGRSIHQMFWYFLNPLVIIELTGNLHFEGVMLFLFLASIYLLVKSKIIYAAPVYAASIMLKLIPLLFLPLLLKFLGVKKSLLFYILVGSFCIVYLLPFYDPELVSNYTKTLELWFSNFEFNAGIYSVVKWIGVEYFDAKAWRLIAPYGTFVQVTTVVFITLLAFLRKNKTLPSLFSSMFLSLLVYYLLSTTVHPWYVIFLLVLGMFTTYRNVAILWSATIILSYFAYSQPDFKPSTWLLGIEYLTVIGFFLYEILKNHNIPASIRKK